MKVSKKLVIFIAFFLLGCLLLTTAYGGAEKIKMTIMIALADDKTANAVVKKVQEHFTDKYEIISKTREQNNAEKLIKTTVAAGEPIDLAMYWPNQMETFVDANMALDLTPYLAENNGAWKKHFTNNSLEIGTYHGKVYAVPYSSVYSLIEANKDLLDKAGVAIPNGSWTWDEFMKACAKIKAKTGVYPAGLSTSWACWSVRNGLLTVWPNKAKMQDFVAGKIPLSDPSVIKVLDNAKKLYDQHLYPGKGALMATLDQINVGFKQGKIAMKMDVNILSAQSIKESGLKHVAILSWPKMGPLDYVLGGCNGYMIPANALHPKDSIEILKYLTSPEIAQIQVDNGMPVTLTGVKSDDPNFALYSKDAQKVYPKEIMQLSPQMNDYIDKKMPANYIFSGKSALNELEMIRKEAIKK